MASNRAMRYLPCKAGNRGCTEEDRPMCSAITGTGIPPTYCPTVLHAYRHAAVLKAAAAGPAFGKSSVAVTGPLRCTPLFWYRPYKSCVDTITGDFLLIYIQDAGILHVVYRQWQRGAAVMLAAGSLVQAQQREPKHSLAQMGGKIFY